MKTLKKASYIYIFLFSVLAQSGELLDRNNRFNSEFELSGSINSNLFLGEGDGVIERYGIKADKNYEIVFRSIHEVSSKGANSYYLFANIYEFKDGNPVLVREVKDFVLDCNFDGGANFLVESFTITDLNGNGRPELTFLYDLKCTGDLSPSRMKLIMLEGREKIALRGLRISEQVYESDIKEVQSTKKELGWGRFKNDNDFRGKHPLFLEFSRLRWDYYKIDLLGR